MGRQLGVLGILCLIALVGFTVHTLFPKSSSHVVEVRPKKVLATFDRSFIGPIETPREIASQHLVESEDPSPECTDAILQFGRAYRDLVRLDLVAIDSRSALKELLGTKVVHDLTYDSPCKNLSSRWSWLSPPATDWSICYAPLPSMEPIPDPKGQFPPLQFNPCEFVVNNFLLASTYLENRGVPIHLLTDVSVVQRIIGAQALMNASAVEAEGYARRWVTLAPESVEAKLEMMAIKQAQAVQDPSAQRIAEYELSVSEYLKKPDPGNEWDQSYARLELSALKKEWKQLLDLSSQLPDFDFRKSYYTAMALHNFGSDDAALEVLRKNLNAQDVYGHGLLKALEKGQWDRLGPRPIIVTQSIGSGAALSIHTWLQDKNTDLFSGVLFDSDIPNY